MPPSPPEIPAKKPFMGKRTRELMVRVASAFVLIPLVLGILWAGGAWFLTLISVGVALLCIEWGLMASPNAGARLAAALTISALAAVFTGYLGHPVLSFLILLFGGLCTGLYGYRLGAGWMDAAYGVLYVGFPAIIIMWLRESNNGLAWVMFAFLIAWASDSAAYVTGKLVGGPKLWRRFSPNKTWSGFAGGMIAGMMTAAALNDLTHLFKHNTSPLIVGVVVSLATMAGDLWESALKRRFGVKDAGSLIPGHGGLMDRVDGLMFAIVALGGIRLLVLLGTEI